MIIFVKNNKTGLKVESGKWKDERWNLVQASESQVYLSFYSECSQGSIPRSGIKVCKRAKAKFTWAFTASAAKVQAHEVGLKREGENY